MWDDSRIFLFMRFRGLSAFSDHFIMVLVRSFHYGICQLLVNDCALNTCRRHRSRVARKTYYVLCCSRGGGGGGNLGVILVRVCGPVF